jgi:hypothetical protein
MLLTHYDFFAAKRLRSTSIIVHYRQVLTGCNREYPGFVVGHQQQTEPLQSFKRAVGQRQSRATDATAKQPP